jgi:hypothetical protein
MSKQTDEFSNEEIARRQNGLQFHGHRILCQALYMQRFRQSSNMIFGWQMPEGRCGAYRSP